MAASFFFYDLETSGFSPRDARIMQFAGQRTDMDLKPVGEPFNLLITLPPDILPDPDAILITAITPQQTVSEGLSEVEFLKVFHDEIATPGTIFMGYNTVRFDDEFMRCLHYRNFYDAYEWQWKDARSRWDLLDVVRMTRALRPEGIAWPFAPDGKPSNRLEYLTAVNKLDHQHAHDALSDVSATIAVADLIKQKQPKLFEYLLKQRDKKEVEKLVASAEPFIYTSGKYPAEFEKTTVAIKVADHPTQQCALVYDLRIDPTPFLAMDVPALLEAWRYSKDPEKVRLPVKTLKYNRCPAVAPMGVLDDASQERLKVDLIAIQKHRKLIAAHPDFADRLTTALQELDKERPQTELLCDDLSVDAKLYDGFFDKHDCELLGVVRAGKPEELASLANNFHDERLRVMLPLYKARNFPKSLSDEERKDWEDYRNRRLLDGGQDSRLSKYFTRLQELAARSDLNNDQRFLLEELQLYGESIMPSAD